MKLAIFLTLSWCVLAHAKPYDAPKIVQIGPLIVSAERDAPVKRSVTAEPIILPSSTSTPCSEGGDGATEVSSGSSNPKGSSDSPKQSSAPLNTLSPSESSSDSSESSSESLENGGDIWDLSSESLDSEESIAIPKSSRSSPIGSRRRRAAGKSTDSSNNGSTAVTKAPTTATTSAPALNGLLNVIAHLLEQLLGGTGLDISGLLNSLTSGSLTSDITTALSGILSAVVKVISQIVSIPSSLISNIVHFVGTIISTVVRLVGSIL